MTTYGAYDAGRPCRNPSCSSNGKPHPNCRCYPDLMAEGGEVSFHCDGPHQPDCEHYLANPPSDVDQIAAAYAHHGATGALKALNIDDHMRAINKGNAKITALLKTLFEDPKSLKRAKPDESAREKLHAYLENGGINQSLREASYPQAPQAFAKGGSVESHPKSIAPILADVSVGAHYPTQNVMMQASRAARENYLNGLRPQKHAIKLPFDDEPDQTAHRREYHQAIDLANDPMSVISEIGHGTLEPEHVKHLAGVSPELTDLLKRKLTEKIIHAQVKNQKPPFHVRQAMSLLLGANLSSELSPESIAAAQATFAGKSAQPTPPAPGKNKRSTATLTKSDEAFLTAPQAREERQQKV
jgi:hypothetical protein